MCATSCLRKLALQRSILWKTETRRTSPFKPAVEVAFQNWAHDLVMGNGHKTLQRKLFYCRFGTRVMASYAFETRNVSKQCLRIQSVPPRKHISPFQRSASWCSLRNGRCLFWELHKTKKYIRHNTQLVIAKAGWFL
jgi:hypothetical protein